MLVIVKQRSIMGFTKGVSGNPNGRPKKGATLTDALVKHLNARLSMVGTAKKQEARDALAEQVVAIALGAPSPADRLTAIKFIYDRIDGKVPDKLAVTGTQVHEIIYGGPPKRGEPTIDE